MANLIFQLQEIVLKQHGKAAKKPQNGSVSINRKYIPQINVEFIVLRTGPVYTYIVLFKFLCSTLLPFGCTFGVVTFTPYH